MLARFPELVRNGDGLATPVEVSGAATFIYFPTCRALLPVLEVRDRYPVPARIVWSIVVPRNETVFCEVFLNGIPKCACAAPMNYMNPWLSRRVVSTDMVIRVEQRFSDAHPMQVEHIVNRSSASKRSWCV